ncbi:hypothetical protein TrVE_jg14212 [Triparma verrucosa]|uniref:peptidylprolyl isomerase n=2 Tax=Triparma TaxID=722752 RepID=A0A9W7AGT6_9STRA|nr:hypothetical protein TrST_g4872 [Triparma strigata]GMH85085.1 hypothetical protein TrVE_jg14212 [Triparma verrucosa]
MAAQLQQVDAETIDIVWAHPRGTSLAEICSNYSQGIDKGPNRVFTQRPATKASLRQHILQNKMLRARCEFSYWVGEPIDIFYYPPATAEEQKEVDKAMKGDAAKKPARWTENVATDALMLQFDTEALQLSPSAIQPHGLCLIVAGGVIDSETEIAGVSKTTVCKLCACIGQLGPVLGDKEKMEVIRKHWKWYDPEKGDKIDKENGEVSRAGKNLSAMVGAEEDKATTEGEGVTYPDDVLIITESGLKYVVVKEGMGVRKPAQGAVVKCHYCGWLRAFESSDKFDSSRDKGKIFETQIGVGAVIKGWDECLMDMKKKEQRMVIIPPDMAYGERGAGGGIIGPNETLYFHIELISF